MAYWLITTLAGVFMVKYYTAVEMRKLERRLERVKEDLTQVKSKLSDAQGDTNRAREEDSFEERVRRIKETIEDLEIRLTTSTEEREDQMVVSDSSRF
jgi:anti-sigma28 factor (negative regulator of flagellin synthesis)